MTGDQPILQQLTQSRLVALVAYPALLFLSVAVIWMSLADLTDRRQALNETAALLDQMKARAGVGARNANSGQPQGSPFLEGPTVTVAGAALLQRVASAITAAGGAIQSSQVNLQGERPKDGFISLLVSGEVAQEQLQKLLYDLEAGMPFLFIDQLDVQMPQAAAATTTTAPSSAKLRVMLGVSGRWQGQGDK